jgi:hypothetical protein
MDRRLLEVLNRGCRGLMSLAKATIEQAPSLMKLFSARICRCLVKNLEGHHESDTNR